jgi:hypothetical protein
MAMTAAIRCRQRRQRRNADKVAARAGRLDRYTPNFVRDSRWPRKSGRRFCRGALQG